MLQKFIYLFVFFELSYFQAFTQNLYLNLGGHLSSICDKDLFPNKEFKINPHVGVGTDIPINKQKNLSVKMEVVYLPKGYIYTANDERYRLNYHYVGILCGMSYMPSSFFLLEGGFELSGLVKAKLFKFSENRSYKVKENYKEMDFGAFMGVILWKGKLINPYLRATYGLRPILNYEEFDELGNVVEQIKDIKNYTIQLGARINFKFTEK